MADNDFKINIKIVSNAFEIEIDRKDEEIYRAASSQINQLISMLNNTYDMGPLDRGEERLICMAALSFAVEKLRLERESGDPQAMERLLKVSNRLGAHLGKFKEMK